MGYRSVTNIFVGTLDNVPDGVVYRRVAGVLGGQVTPGSIQAAAIQSYHIGNNQVSPVQTSGWTGVISALSGNYTVINGLVVGDGTSSSSGDSSSSGTDSSSGDSPSSSGFEGSSGWSGSGTSGFSGSGESSSG
jgi:hypothetical protein